MTVKDLRATLRSVVGYTVLMLAFSFVGLVIIVGFLWMDGHLNATKLERIGAILREDPRAAPIEADPKPALGAQTEIDAARKALAERDQRWREEHALLSGALRTVKEELERERKELAVAAEEFREERRQFEAERAADLALRSSDSFQNNVRILAALSPKDAAAFLRDWDSKVIVPYVRRLRDRDSSKLLVELNVLDERKATEVRSLLRDQALEAAVPPPSGGDRDGASIPSAPAAPGR